MSSLGLAAPGPGGALRTGEPAPREAAPVRRKTDRAPSFETGSEARPPFDDSGPALPSRLEVTA